MQSKYQFDAIKYLFKPEELVTECPFGMVYSTSKKSRSPRLVGSTQCSFCRYFKGAGGYLGNEFGETFLSVKCNYRYCKHES